MTSKGRRLQHGCCVLVLIMLLSVWPSRAQEVTARLAGTVKDPAGAMVPEAVLAATNVSTGLVTRTTSGASGDYIFLAAGSGNLHSFGGESWFRDGSDVRHFSERGPKGQLGCRAASRPSDGDR